MKPSWRERLRSAFSRDRSQEISTEELRTILYESDLSSSLVERLAAKFDQLKSHERPAVRQALVEELQAALSSTQMPTNPLPTPGALLLLGVNGAGKTTVAAKLAY